MTPALSRAFRAVPPVVWCLAALCALPELVLQGADWGLWGSARWRPLAYAQGAFWAGLLYGWMPNYPGQPVLMFFTYAWLHAGIGHLLGNLGALFWLGPDLARRLGPWRLLALWGAGMLGGAALFAGLPTTASPMVGASGALFGLAGAAAVVAARNWRQGLLLALGLVALNVAAWVSAGGHLAWQAHVGGMLAGAAALPFLRPKVRPSPPDPT
jgi:membrane associated rhomboid family serine protease